MALLGESLSKESKELMKASKRATMNQKFNWVIIEPYLDVAISNGSTGKTKEHVTFRQFKDLIVGGKSMRDLRNEGVSKHILQFMSNFAQGKIKLTKDAFEKDYLAGMELNEISEKYTITRDDLTYLRQVYDIDRKGPKFIARKKNEVALTDRQREIIIGSMMGDAKRTSPSSVGFGHGLKQKDYLLWKYQELQNISSSNSLKPWSSIDKRNGKTHISWRFYTNANTEIEKIVSLFHKQGDKQICQEILDQMTSLSVAVWYMDDGRTDIYARMTRKYPKRKYSPMLYICTDSFSHDSCTLIKDWFFTKFSIKVRIKERGLNKQGTPRNRIIVENESVNDFISLISPHILPIFHYKINCA